jgi:hypothetical protein
MLTGADTSRDRRQDQVHTHVGNNGLRFHYNADRSGSVIVTGAVRRADGSISIPMDDLVEFAGELVRHEMQTELEDMTGAEVLFGRERVAPKTETNPVPEASGVAGRFFEMIPRDLAESIAVNIKMPINTTFPDPLIRETITRVLDDFDRPYRPHRAPVQIGERVYYCGDDYHEADVYIVLNVERPWIEREHHKITLVHPDEPNIMFDAVTGYPSLLIEVPPSIEWAEGFLPAAMLEITDLAERRAEAEAEAG